MSAVPAASPASAYSVLPAFDQKREGEPVSADRKYRESGGSGGAVVERDCNTPNASFYNYYIYWF